MQLVIVSFFYQPEPNDIKIHLLAKEMVARGHTVTTITTFPNYPSGKIYDGYKQRLWQKEVQDGVRIFRVPLYPNHTRSGIKRALSYSSFMLTAATLGLMRCGRADVIWVYHPPLTTGVAGVWMSFMRRAPFVLDIQDMWPETLKATGMLNNERVLRWIGRVANWIYRRASALTVNAPGMKTNIIAKGIAEDKIFVMPNWADERIYMPKPRDVAIGEKYGLMNKFNIMFAGNMGLVQALDKVIEAAELLHELPDVQLVMIGDGLEYDNLRNRVTERGLTNVIFLGRHPASAMPDFFAWADGLLITLTDDPLYAMTIPSKTQSYLACGRPIICAVAGDGANVIEQAGAGLTCPPENPHALADAIRHLYALSPEERDIMGARGRQAYLSQFQQAIIVDRYEQVFLKVMKKKKNT
jgi:glycosyltransferase involved in cell wall biosynthesis